jgi:hypothetical protein
VSKGVLGKEKLTLEDQQKVFMLKKEYKGQQESSDDNDLLDASF